jgi:hypothetical protein
MAKDMFIRPEASGVEPQSSETTPPDDQQKAVENADHQDHIKEDRHEAEDTTAALVIEGAKQRLESQHEDSFVYLSTFQQRQLASTELNEDVRAIEALKSIAAYANHTHIKRSVELAIKHNFSSVLVNLLANELTNLSSQSKDDAGDFTIAKKSEISYADTVMTITRNFTNHSASFCVELIDLNVVNILVKYLKVEPLIASYMTESPESKDKDDKTSQVLLNQLKLIKIQTSYLT